MTRRATFTQAELDRAAKVAAARGWGVVVTKAGDIILAPVEALPLPSPDDSAAEVAECDKAFGVSR